MSTTAERPGRLAPMIAGLIREATRTARVHRLELQHGLRVAVRAWDGEIVLTMSRAGVPVGAAEERVIVRDAAIPPTARRIPAVGQWAAPGARPGIIAPARQCVTYVWREEEPWHAMSRTG